MNIRTSGVLLHITSLFNRYGIGDLGSAAFRFAHILTETSQSIWQVLPLNPTDSSHGHSPYYSISAFAGNPLLISPDLLENAGWVTAEETQKGLCETNGHVDFDATKKYKECLFNKAFERFITQGGKNEDFWSFCEKADGWMDDYALFTLLKQQFAGEPWNKWPIPIRDRKPEALFEIKNQYAKPILREKFLQYLFFSQWYELKAYCNRMGIRIFGDMPIYMPYDSVDVWANPKQFKLDDNLEPMGLSGVPPDYFSATGQLWGHPVYDWKMQQQERYPWWTRRIKHNMDIFDIVRIDHFRGLVGFWEVSPGAKTAQTGKWIAAPAEDFLTFLYKRFGNLPIVAEDLGTITPDVIEVLRRFDLPGMRVLQFGFGEGDFPHSTHLPHLYEKNCVVYTGTHDNNTTVGWYETEINEKVKENVHRYLGRKSFENGINWEMIRMAMMSVAEMAIIPVQDLLGLNAYARMNIPGKSNDNWRWRMTQDELTAEIREHFRMVTCIYGRSCKNPG
jgi:4-alpha-glucanotransferase